jgi:hypothetical protein
LIERLFRREGWMPATQASQGWQAIEDIGHVRCGAEQLPKLDRWAAMLDYICQRSIGSTALPTPPPALPAPGQLLFLD